jgi:hypothetical protein
MLPAILQRDRKQAGWSVGQAAWRLGVIIREYREIEAGDREPSRGTYERISELYGWPRTFVASVRPATNRVLGSDPTSQADRH